MLTTIMRICTRVPIEGMDEGFNTLSVLADVRLCYERDNRYNYEPNILNFDASDILLSEIVYTNQITGENIFISEDSLETEDIAALYIAVEASALSFVQSKIEYYIEGKFDEE